VKYFFVLGSNLTLSIAEISAFFGADADRAGAISLKSGVLIFSAEKKIDADAVIKRLGGTVKIGKITAEISSVWPEEILKEIVLVPHAGGGKYKFGVSFYGRPGADIKRLAMEIKKNLREQGISSRWVTSRDPVLSSVVVTQNKLIEKGMELVLIADGNKLLVGRTLAVQPFKELSRRDYGRPARDDASGMLPPKLAMIMINLARPKPGGTILDPFCGSGTILTEAMLMGYRRLIGADISGKAAEDTRENIEWIIKNYELRITSYELWDIDVKDISGRLDPRSIDAIVTEPYLGPQRGKFNGEQIAKELEKLYSTALAEFKKILKPGGRVVMIWPVFIKHGTHSTKHAARNMEHKTRNTIYVSPDLGGFKIINPLPSQFLANAITKTTNRNTIIYGRPGQKVWREIVTLRN